MQKTNFWLQKMGRPEPCNYLREERFIRCFSEMDFDGEMYLQSCGSGEWQKLLLLCPKTCTAGPFPAVALPFYHPDGMLGFDLETGTVLEEFRGITMARDLVKRGFAVVAADAFPFHFFAGDCELESGNFHCDFARYNDPFCWKVAAEHLYLRHPQWSGIGKLIADTTRMIDFLAADNRIDSARIGIAGHSLGGKMAFYTGYLDSRVRAILANDFGLLWDSTNWGDEWYWGKRLQSLREQGIDHRQLMAVAPEKPFMLLAGEYDNTASEDFMYSFKGFRPDRHRILNHASGHLPPYEALSAGYDFLAYWLQCPTGTGQHEF